MKSGEKPYVNRLWKTIVRKYERKTIANDSVMETRWVNIKPKKGDSIHKILARVEYMRKAMKKMGTDDCMVPTDNQIISKVLKMVNQRWRVGLRRKCKGKTWRQARKIIGDDYDSTNDNAKGNTSFLIIYSDASSGSDSNGSSDDEIIIHKANLLKKRSSRDYYEPRKKQKFARKFFFQIWQLLEKTALEFLNLILLLSIFKTFFFKFKIFKIWYLCI